MEPMLPSTSRGITKSNPMVEFCLLKHYSAYLPYFSEHQYESIDTFLMPPNVRHFLLAHPGAATTTFFSKLNEFTSSRLTTTITPIDEDALSVLSSSSTQDDAPSHAENGSLLPTQISSMFFVNQSAAFPFIKNGQFSVAGLQFPPMPEQFVVLNQEPNLLSETVLQGYTTKHLSTLFLDVCRRIWDYIKPAYPINIPEIVVHEICASFTREFPLVQANLERLFSSRVTEFADIGKLLKIKFKNLKKSRSEAMKRQGSWVYPPGEKGKLLAEKKRKSVQLLLETKRNSGKLSLRQQLEEAKRENAILLKDNEILQTQTTNRLTAKISLAADEDTDAEVSSDESTIDGEEASRLQLKIKASKSNSLSSKVCATTDSPMKTRKSTRVQNSRVSVSTASLPKSASKSTRGRKRRKK